jgi:hypothetical protein
VNVFKDKLVMTFDWALNDLARIVRAPGFSAAALAKRARETALATVAWVVADFMVERGAEPWAAVRAAFGRPPRPRYARRVRKLFVESPTGLGTRTLARIASDEGWRSAAALVRAVGWTVEDKIR